MEQNSTTNSGGGKGLGIAALIVGIVATVFSFIPCVGMWAIIPGIVGIILASISMKQTGPGGSKGMAIGGLITSVIGLLIAIYWLYVVYFVAHEGVEQLKEELEKTGVMDSLNKAMEQLKEVVDSTQTH